MLEKSLGLLFFLKQPQNYTNGPMYIYLRITVDGRPKELSTKRLWNPERWNQDAGRASGTKEDARTLNNYLDTLNNKAHEVRRYLLENNKEITAKAIKERLSGIDETSRMILDIFQLHNDQMKALVNIDFAPATLTRYTTSLAHTTAFIKWKYKVPDLHIKSLDFEFIDEYACWLKTKRKCSHNTTMKYLANFKKVVLKCVKNRWLPADPFTEFKLTKNEVEKDALTELELKKISNKQFECDRLSHVRDIFLFSCYTGLAYADVKKLGRNDIKVGFDSHQWIIIKRQKTNTPSRIPLLPVAQQLIDKYKEHPICMTKNVLLPVLSNQKMNAYLKEIADLSKVSKNITFHIARHTFATTVTLNNDVPIETVSDMLGHKSIKQTQHYAKLLDKKIGVDMQKLKKKLSEEPAGDKNGTCCDPFSTQKEEEIDKLVKPVKVTYGYTYTIV